MLETLTSICLNFRSSYKHDTNNRQFLWRPSSLHHTISQFTM